MRVNDLRERILELSHHSSTDPDVRTKALGWLNAAYLEVLQELLVYAPHSLQRTESVTTDDAGFASLASPANQLVRVLMAEQPLPIVSPLALREADPLQTAAGTPQRAALVAGGVQVQPRRAVALTVVYTPQPLPLVEDGPETSLLLPPAQHDALIWGGLVWSALYERGLASANELNLFSRQWAEAKTRLKLAALASAAAPLRVARADAV